MSSPGEGKGLNNQKCVENKGERVLGGETIGHARRSNSNHLTLDSKKSGLSCIIVIA
jgi:hypothetical protein